MALLRGAQCLVGRWKSPERAQWALRSPPAWPEQFQIREALMLLDLEQGSLLRPGPALQRQGQWQARWPQAAQPPVRPPVALDLAAPELVVLGPEVRLLPAWRVLGLRLESPVCPGKIPPQVEGLGALLAQMRQRAHQPREPLIQEPWQHRPWQRLFWAQPSFSLPPFSPAWALRAARRGLNHRAQRDDEPCPNRPH